MVKGRVSRMLRDPVAWILAIAGVVEMISGGTPARGAILFAGAALIILDRIRLARAVPVESVESGPETAGTAVGPATNAGSRLVFSGRFVVLAVAGALLISLFAIHSWPLTVCVGVVGLLGLGWAWSTLGGIGATDKVPTSAWLPWGVVLLILAVWEMSALIGQPTLEVGSYAHPTISFLLDPVLATYPGRVLGVLLWLAAGRALVRRA